MSATLRRVVTGHNTAGRSVVIEDGAVPSVAPFGLTEFWKTDHVPACLSADGRPQGLRLEPPPGGTLFRFFEIAPHDPSLSPEEAETRIAAAFQALGASHCRVDTHRHPLMHTTRTIDYVVLLRGEVTLLLDEGEVALRPFDVVVQRGTNHSWVNRGSEPALFLAVLVDAQA
jgi:quercetin dioxygenase-like cupin family protein